VARSFFLLVLSCGFLKKVINRTDLVSHRSLTVILLGLPNGEAILKTKGKAEGSSEIAALLLLVNGNRDGGAEIERSLTELEELGARREDLLPFVVALLIGAKAMKKMKEKDWTIPPGMTWQGLKRFPNRLRETAKQIEKLNAHPLFDPSRVLSQGGRKTDRPRLSLKDAVELLASPDLAKNFRYLGPLLSGYATYIDALRIQTGQFKRRRGHYGDRLKGTQIELIEYVRTKTGHKHYDQVASLIDAIFTAAGTQAGAIAPGALQRLYDRNPHLRQMPQKTTP